MKQILKKYLNQTVGLNIEKPFRFDKVKIIAVKDDYFSVEDQEQKYIHHFAYRSIVQITEHQGGVDIGGFLSNQHFLVVIKVGHLFEYIPA